MDTNKFNAQVNGKDVSLYRISTEEITCYITNFGARVVSLMVKDKDGIARDVVLGFDSLDGYFTASEQYHGATVGRYANRIANAKFKLNDVEYNLNSNNETNSLHGGIEGFHQQVWEVKSAEERIVTMQYGSPHLEEGFPGELDVLITYEVKGGELFISYSAKSSKDTVVNFTHHSYFNLNGEGAGPVIDHSMEINADYYTPVNENTIPIGRLDLVSGTAFDFRSSKRIGKNLYDDDIQLQLGSGFDHNFVVNNYVPNNLGYVATAMGEQSGIEMQVWSTEPGVQLYTANHFDGQDVGKAGELYKANMAFCLESQHFPDSPNQPHFPSTLLKAGELFLSRTEYRFAVK